MKKMTCECPYTGDDHALGDCKCTTNLQVYERDGQRLTLCCNCSMPGDVPVHDDDAGDAGE